MYTKDLAKHDITRNLDSIYFCVNDYAYIIDMLKVHYNKKEFNSRVWSLQFSYYNNNPKKDLLKTL